ncbi:MAG: VanZ family protein [Bacteroidales bacterium]|jgi:VanZ family protein|nr:VanZ family protein [Bacteroidaceae bacterium]MBR6974860.1 VanZ family protein [Bacteroidaceae bacterium]MDO4202773.1 VanZ family protein [Bacteroidales bacterium]
MKLKQYIVTVLVTLSIIVLSTLPIPEDAPMSDVPLIDKWVHMVMYMGLVLAMWFDHVVRSEKKAKGKHFLFMFLYATLLGGLMELVQAYLTTCRSGDLIDFEADAIGAAIGVGLTLFVNKLWAEKTSVQN